jgi:hypothetical protein
MSLRERTRPGLGIIEPCLPSPANAPAARAGACLATAGEAAPLPSVVSLRPIAPGAELSRR